MSEYLTQEIPSAQPQPQETPGSSPPSSQNTQPPIPPDDINSSFAILDTRIVSAPYNNDTVADALMHLMMNVRAWSEARPAYEAEREKEYLVAEIKEIEAREREQGRFSFPVLESVRQRLVGFIASVKSALDDLQG